MNDILDDFKSKWDDAKKDKTEHPTNTKDLIVLSKQKMRSAVIMHIKNIAVLALTLIGLSAFFLYVANFKETMSHVGMSLMIGGLVLRILIECYSIYRSSKIDLSNAASTVNESYLRFYTYRKRIHGSVTIAILLAYTVGFYLLIPEFSEYLSTITVILIAFSYLIAAAIFGYSIRMAIRDEMKFLQALTQLEKEMKIND